MASRKELVGALGALLRRISAADTLDDIICGSVYDNAHRIYAQAVCGNKDPQPWKPLRQVRHGSVTEAQIASCIAATGYTEAQVREMFARITTEETLWINHTYQVNRRELGGGGVHLSIKRIDQEPVHDWRDLQRIKNELLGPECEAVELCPAESRRVDSANQYHLWGDVDPAFRFGFGFNERLTSASVGTHLQRPAADL